jgi:hypothetical protein
MGIRKFYDVFQQEVAAINKRREVISKRGKGFERPPIRLEEEAQERDGTPILRPTAASKVVGLALSGGGIRSAAFCLGAMQALNERHLIEKIDYLSTVSGGGYTGTSMTAAMSTGCAGTFPFASELKEGEVAAVQHIRDHSNYLFPQGLLNLFGNIVVYLRGLMANVVIILPWLLLAAALTVWLNPDVKSLTTNVAGDLVPLPISVPHFGLTLNALLGFVGLLAVWALWRSTSIGRNHSDVGTGARGFGMLVTLILVVAFCELQPLLLNGMFKIAQVGTDEFFANISKALTWAAGVLASIGTIVGFLGRFLADSLKRNSEKPGFTAFAARIAIKLAMYLAGAAVPVALWVAYLYLAFWGLQDPDNAPQWLKAVAAAAPLAGGSIFWLYVVVGLALMVLSWIFSPNANSLHRLYRDRLGKAFLFDPTQRVAGSDLKSEENLKLSKLRTDLAPYHLINAALNIAASKYANRRGRNADFYFFSPLFTGSKATGYVETIEMEKYDAGLSAGSAMAVSGAAASANMGSATIKPLVPTLAILNVRLGYWLPNPKAVARVLKMRPFLARMFDQAYFVQEILGLLREDKALIYLTDGGHVENLGIYELLRRRCKLIIAIDGEADPEMGFGSLVTLERYARIDFSLRIDLPWAALRNVTRDASKEILKSGGLPPGEAPHGPHCALGTIYYPRKTPNESESDSTGLLLYIKSSFTGDENDYVVDYKRRNSAFPHETTADQLFSEEQFEAYRALGFHAVNSAFKGADEVSMNPNPAKWQGPQTTHPLEKRLHDILG